MSATIRSLRSLAAGLTLAAALPVLAQESDSPPPPPPPEALPWAAPPPPAPPPSAPPRAQAEQPVYRPDYVYPPRRDRRQVRPDEEYGPPARWAGRRQWAPHLELSFRGGVASPDGMAAEGLTMDGTLGRQLTAGVELGLRTTPHLFVGFLLEGGVGDPGRYSGGSCSGLCDSTSSTGRLGFLVRYHLAPFSGLDPWVAYGVAATAARVSGSTPTGDYSRTLTGVEYAKLSVGADLRLGGHAALGLYAEWTRGSFSHLEDRQNGVLVASGELADTTSHSWFMMGPRLTF